MKTHFLSFIFSLLALGCSKDNPDPTAQLPLETQTGANTFGCIINNQVFYPRDGVGNFGGGIAERGVYFWGDHTQDQHLYNEIDCGNYKDGKPANWMIIHLQGLHQNGIGEYVWQTTNFQSNIDGPMQNYAYARIFDPSSNTWKYYGSYENSGKVLITKNDIPNKIVSGTFSGKLRLKNGTEEIDILQGRFDFDKNTLSTTQFP